MLMFLSLMVGQTQASEQRVFDQADLVEEADEIALEQEIAALEDTYHMEVVLVTITDAQGKSAKAYAEDYYDDNFGEDGMLMLIDMDNRELYITYTGSMLRYFTDARQDYIEDHLYPYIADGNYADGFYMFLEDAEKYLKQGIPKGQYTVAEQTTEDKVKALFIQLPVALILSFGIGFLITKQKTRRGRKQDARRAAKKQAAENVEFRINETVLVDTQTTHVYVKPAQAHTSSTHSSSKSSSSARTTTHRSSSGRSHSGGGRKF